MVYARLSRLSPTTFTGKICLVDFCNQEQACVAEGVSSDHESEVVRLIAPNGVPIWKVRWYTCEGEGTVDILANDCVYDCCALYPDNCVNLEVCPGQSCTERWHPSSYFGDPRCVPPDWPAGEYWGQHAVKVQLTNNVPECRRVTYWWKQKSNGQWRDSAVYGVTLGANETIYLCHSLGLYQADDRIYQFKFLDPARYPRGPAGELVAMTAGEKCCPAGGACIETQPWNPTPCISPFYNPPCW